MVNYSARQVQLYLSTRYGLDISHQEIEELRLQYTSKISEEHVIQAHALQHALQELGVMGKDRYRDLVDMRRQAAMYLFTWGYSIPEIAHILQRSKAATYNLLQTYKDISHTRAFKKNVAPLENLRKTLANTLIE